MNLTMNRWQNDTAALADLRTDWNDKLEIVDDRLHLEKGTRRRDSGEAITMHPANLAAYLDALITITAKECFQALQATANDSPAYYEQIADFKRQVKHVSHGVNHLEYTFRRRDCDNSDHALLYSQLCDKVSAFLTKVKEHKSTLKKPLLSERPVKHTVYNTRTELTTLVGPYPKRVPVEETVAAAKQALSLAQALKPASSHTSGVVGLFRTLLWSIADESIQEKEAQRHMKAYQSYSTQLLRRPIITQEAAAAFKELAPHAELLDLENAILASENMTELAPFIKEDARPGAIPVSTYLHALKQICTRKHIKLQTLRTVEFFYKLHNDVYLSPRRERKEVQSLEVFIDEHMKEEADLNMPNSANPYVSPSILQELFNAASSSATCREIVLSKELMSLQFVRNFLQQHSYRLREDKEYCKKYKR